MQFIDGVDRKLKEVEGYGHANDFELVSSGLFNDESMTMWFHESGLNKTFFYFSIYGMIPEIETMILGAILEALGGEAFEVIEKDLQQYASYYKIEIDLPTLAFKNKLSTCIMNDIVDRNEFYTLI